MTFRVPERAVQDADDLSSAASSQHDSDVSSENEDTSTFGSSAEREGVTKDEQEQKEVIAAAETRTVFRLRVVVFLVLVASTVGVALVVYFYTSNAEKRDFEDAYYDNAEKVFEAVGATLGLTLGAIDAFAISLVSYANYSNSSWPFVTLPDFAVRASKMRSQTKSIVSGFYPLVHTAERELWQNYSLTHDGWVADGVRIQNEDDGFHGARVTEWTPYGVIHGNSGPVEGPGPYLPTWQTAPIVPVYAPYNWDMYASDVLRPSVIPVLRTKKVVIGETLNIPDPNNPEDMEALNRTAVWAQGYIGKGEDPTEPLTAFYYPIVKESTEYVRLDPNDPNTTIVGVIATTIYWREIINDILPGGSKGNIVVFGNECNQSFTYQVDGPTTKYLGRGDRHDPKFDQYGRAARLIELDAFSTKSSTYSGATLSEDFCPYWMKVYPSSQMEDMYTTSNPIIFTVAAVLIFGFTSLVFIIYDYTVEQRQRKVLRTAMQSSAIVSSLFPSVVRDRLFPMANDSSKTNDDKDHNKRWVESQKNRLQTFINDGKSSSGGPRSPEDSSRPIADLFPETTVMFADISGFTAWSSMREPAQVFILLESIYGAFDGIAKRRGVFKVETIGDSYVAVAGLPDPRKDHAVVMARFAKDCNEKMVQLTKELEVSLGPDTGDLAMRFGLHSGPVTAGVLRGERSRFQLFGDTVNTAARMESTGICNKIQASQTTVNYLNAAGKSNWVTPRDELIEAKGKGLMQTYWIEPRAGKKSSSISDSSVSNHEEKHAELGTTLDEKTIRLVDWNVEVLSRILKQILARRSNVAKSSPRIRDSRRSFNTGKDSGKTMVLEEVCEIIELPDFNEKSVVHQESALAGEVDSDSVNQLRTYVTIIAQLYHKENPFHCFEHASHVTMSAAKLLSRIVSPDHAYHANDDLEFASTLHDHTYGITSDPLTQFACVFSALIHDVDHPGVPNATLVKENAHIACVYKGKSVAEQNSVDIAWKLFMEETFDELRTSLCPTEEELKRFRQLIVNAVMATDILDQDLKNLRNARWERAFSETPPEGESMKDNRNRKATIVIEHLLQASDVAHTMQHWHIYRKWNERLFHEMYGAYLAGRADIDPSVNWYKGELGFFDFYVLPLAKKLSECGVFGVSSDEYMNYAQKNREEWEAKGNGIVAEMLQRYHELHSMNHKQKSTHSQLQTD